MGSTDKFNKFLFTLFHDYVMNIFTQVSQVVASSSSIKRVYFCMWILNCIKLLKALKSVFKPLDFLD